MHATRHTTSYRDVTHSPMLQCLVKPSVRHKRVQTDLCDAENGNIVLVFLWREVLKLFELPLRQLPPLSESLALCRVQPGLARRPRGRFPLPKPTTA